MVDVDTFLTTLYVISQTTSANPAHPNTAGPDPMRP